MIRVSNYKTEQMVLVFALMPFCILFLNFFVSTKNEISYTALAIFVAIDVGFVFFIRFAVKNFYLNFQQKTIVVRNVFSRKALYSMRKNDVECLELPATFFGRRLKVTTKTKRTYYTYLGFGKKRRFQEFLNNW